MIDQLVKIAIAGIAAYAADRFVKNKTGKHIHEHAVDFVKALWTRLKRWAQKYLSEHPRIRKVYTSPINIAAAIKRATHTGLDFVRVKVFGQEVSGTRKTIRTEDIPLDQAQAALDRAKTDSVLAQQV